MQKLDSTIPDQLTYQNDLLKLTALGGIKLEGLDRMRATLKIELKNSSLPPVRHNLDLYNDNQLEKLIRKTSERLEVGTNVISASLSEFTDNLEQYRLEQQKTQEAEQYQKKTLTKEERQQAENFLKEPNLLQRTNELIGQSGVVGEETNRLIMYLIFTSRKREQPLHIVSLGSSGTGKTHLQEKVGELIPEEETLSITTLSENSFYYFGKQELKNKLILIEDLDGAESSLYPLRELQSKKRISKTIAHKNTKGETRTIHLVVEGPVSVAGCTTREQIYEDNANRSFLIYLDESEEQDNLIMNYQRAHSANKINKDKEEKVSELLRNCQRILQPVKIVNPFAELLQIPKEVFKPRRTNNHYLQFIEAITFYHQYQRQQKIDKETGELYIETTLEDVEEANQLMKQILIRKSDNLTGACRNHFERLKLYLIGEKEKQFTNRQISNLFRTPITTIKRYHLDLVLNGYLKVNKEKGSKSHHYEVVSYEEYKQLQKLINTVLDESLSELEKNLSKHNQPKSPEQPSSKSGLVKTHKTNNIEAVNHKTSKKVSRSKKNQRREISEGALNIYETLKTHMAENHKTDYRCEEVMELLNRKRSAVNHYLKLLCEHNLLERETKNNKYHYSLPI